MEDGKVLGGGPGHSTILASRTQDKEPDDEEAEGLLLFPH